MLYNTILQTFQLFFAIYRLEKNQTIAYSETEVNLVLAVNCLCKVLITGLGKTVLLIQNIQDTHQLCLNQICKVKSQRQVLD